MHSPWIDNNAARPPSSWGLDGGGQVRGNGDIIILSTIKINFKKILKNKEIHASSVFLEIAMNIILIIIIKQYTY